MPSSSNLVPIVVSLNGVFVKNGKGHAKRCAEPQPKNKMMS